MRVVLASATLVLALLGCSREQPKAAEDTPPAVTVTTVTARAISKTVAASGTIVAREEAAVGAELSGYRVLRVLAEEGDFVRRGQTLAVLDPTLLDEQLAQAEVAAQRAASEYSRVADLKGRGIIADETIAQRGFEARSTASQLRDLRKRRARLTLSAPVAGLVLSRTLRPGDIASAGGSEPYFRIARDGLMELNAEVPEAEFGRIRLGTTVPVQLASGEKFTGTIRLISPRVDPQTKLGRLRILLPRHPSLRLGGFARTTIAMTSAAGPCVPERAIQYSAAGPSVTIVGDDNRVRRVPVRIAARGGGFAQLAQGPPAGARVLLGGAALVLPGDKVRPELAK